MIATLFIYYVMFFYNIYLIIVFDTVYRDGLYVRFTTSDNFKVVAFTKNTTHLFVVHYDVGGHFLSIISKDLAIVQQKQFRFFLGTSISEVFLTYGRPTILIYHEVRGFLSSRLCLLSL